MKKTIFFIHLLFMIFLPSISLSAEIPEFNNYYEDSLNRGLRNIDPYIYYLLNNPQLCSLECLEKLEDYSFDTPPLYLRLSEMYFSEGNKKEFFSGINSFSRFLESLNKSTIWKAETIHIFIIAALFGFFLTSLLIIFVRAPLDLPIYLYEMREKRIVFVIMIILLSVSLYGLPYLAGTILLLYARKSSAREKIFTLFYLLILLLLPFILIYERTIFNISTDNLSRAVADVNEGRDNTRALYFLRDAEDKDWRLRFSYALALKREGNIEESLTIFKELSDLRKDDYRLLNNIGNGLFLGDKVKEAIDYYTRSSELKERPHSFYNLSQAYKESLEFQKAMDYYQKAININPRFISWFSQISTRDRNRFLIDETLDSSSIWDFAINRARHLETRSINVFDVLIPVIMGIILFIKSPVDAYRCSKCGKIIVNISRKKRLWGMMCADCYDVLVSPDKTDSKTRLERILFLQRKKENKRKIFTLLSILPGPVEFYSGRIIAGFVISLLFSFSFGLMVLSSIYTIETFRQSYIFYSGLILLCIVLMIHFFTAWRLRKWV